MATRVSFHTSQNFGECNCFIFEDNTGNISLTNPGGYGAPNLEITDVTKTEIYITTVSGIKYKVNKIYKPDRLPIKICTSDLVDFENVQQQIIDPGCGCTKTVTVFQPRTCPDPLIPTNCEPVKKCGGPIADGCNFIEYYVFANTTSKRVCDYKVEGIFLQEGQKLWANKNGTLVDVTELIEDGTYIVEQTNDKYIEWLVKSDQTVDQSGTFTQLNCNIITLAEPEEVIVSYAIKNVVFLCNTETRLSRATYKINIENEECTNCLKNGLLRDQVNSLLALAISKFQVIKNNPGCNCACINSNIKQINHILDRIYGDCN